MSRIRTSVIALGVLCMGTLASAQLPPTTGPGGAISAGANWGFATVKRNVLEAAQKMPDAEYGFKPVDGVRTFGQLVGHVANAQFAFCSTVKGEANPNQGKNSETLATKAELVGALEQSIAYCDGVYAGMTDAQGVGMVKLFGTEMSKITALYGNVAHTNEHYGNLVTYMRIKGHVPPSTERAQAPRR
jgi:uncharacterized damage-inducible protein DinB